jgi:Mg/Co/Ni transporter MgtE
VKTVGHFRRLIADKAFLVIRRELKAIDFDVLSECWPEFTPLEKLVLFKLQTPANALDFYEGLEADEQYFLLSGFEINTIAPLLEDLPEKSRALFQKLPESYYDKMLHLLACQQVEMEVAVQTN